MNKSLKTQQKRLSPRLKLTLRVHVYFSADTVLTLSTRDMSHNGLFIECTPPANLAAGQQLDIQLADPMAGDTPQKIAATVTRITAEGFAVSYNEQ